MFILLGAYATALKVAGALALAVLAGAGAITQCLGYCR